MPTISEALEWLAGEQTADGSFAGGDSTRPQPFAARISTETIFFTTLILSCLEGLDSPLINKAVDFLLDQSGPLGSWNYWRRDSAWSVKLPYPDDLDDTACVLAALRLHRPAAIDAPVLADLAKLLISNEIKPGGPYRTWLVEASNYDKWGDVDVAVNANVGYLLSRLDVRVGGLHSYIDEQLDKRSLDSRYYLGEIPTLYFLARWYRGPNFKLLKQYTRQALLANDNNSLGLAMLLSAGCRLGLAAADLRQARRRLIDQARGDHWPAEALYKDFSLDGIQYYAGSAALTTGFAIEALNSFDNYMNQPASNDDVRIKPPKPVDLSGQGKPPPEIHSAYRRAVQAIEKGDRDGQITHVADITAAAYGWSGKTRALNNLNRASLNGWVAYSIYDDIYDDESTPANLAVANYACRQALMAYRRALPNNKEFQQLVGTAFDTIDAANRWEVLNARGYFDAKGKLYYELPAYGHYAKLAGRSWGHMLAACGSLQLFGLDIQGQPSRQLRRFFYHYLIARQLNDDAHDWYEDLRRGHLSPVVCLLLNGYATANPIDLRAELAGLRLHYWRKTIHEVSDAIQRELKLARKALRLMGMSDPSVFESWLASIAGATELALTGSRETQAFIEAFTAPTGNLYVSTEAGTK